MLELHTNSAKRQAMLNEFEQLHRQLRQDASVEGAKAILELAAKC
jgi:lipid A disaccharide synthetase